MELNAAPVERRSQPCPLLFSCYKNVFASLHVFTFHCMILKIPTQVLFHGGKTQRRPKPTGVNLTEPNNFFGRFACFWQVAGPLGLTCLSRSQEEGSTSRQSECKATYVPWFKSAFSSWFYLLSPGALSFPLWFLLVVPLAQNSDLTAYISVRNRS